ncbi:hypothetical protein ACIQWN_32525 [Streptomyces vinaceus]|uniref:hypothetical protein n=1 Tax=Streptomyces vinaceus TaxID=1960 RepID=UPI003801DA1B
MRTDAGSTLLAGSASGVRREILLRANGNRSVRDIAFLLGRSLYAVTVEVARLTGEGLLETVRPAQLADPRGGPSGPASPPPPPTRASGHGPMLPLRPVTRPWPPPAPSRHHGTATRATGPTDV